MNTRVRAGGVARGALLTALLALLAACSSTPTSSPPSGRRTASTGGGYYLDDGPGTGAPSDLASIPDATPRREAILARTSRPYVVFGRTYTPRSELVPYREQGVASWYGRKFHGQKTSSGEIYDMYAMTAAHPTLPIPSYVRVTSLDNGRSVVVRVNDRGPFLNNRLIDLSWTAAAKLGYVSAGHSRVEVEQITQFDGDDGLPVRVPDNVATAPGAVIASGVGANALVVSTQLADSNAGADASRTWGDGPTSSASSLAIEAIVVASAGERSLEVSTGRTEKTSVPSPFVADTESVGHYMQLAAYRSRDGAEAGRAMLARQAEWIVPRVQVRLDGGFYKLRAGPFAQREHALQAAERLRMTTELKPIITTR